MDEPTPPRRPDSVGTLPRRRQLAIVGRLFAAAAAIILLVIIVRALFGGHETPPPPVEPGTFRPTPEQMKGLKVQPVVTMEFHSEEDTDGKIALDDDITTPFFSPYSGRVTRLLVKSGDVVEKGTPLFGIEATEFVQAENDLISAAATLKTADAQLKLAQNNEKRQHQVYEAKGGALKDWLQSQSDLVNAEGAHRTAEIALAAVRNRLRILGKTDQEINAIENAPESTRTNPETLVTAPVGGTVIQRQIAVGQYINSAASGASNPVYSIGDLSKVWLVGNVREVDAPKVHVGQPVEVRTLAFPDRVFKAKLSYVGATVDDTTRRVTVRAEVENPDLALKPEMFGSFRIFTSDATNAVGVPESAVVYEGDTAHVWVARDDGLVALRLIRTGRTMDGVVEVLDGLKAGEKVVTKGTLFIDRAAEGD
ncbi:MAG TPA: efflux RND transporter periplasmic adaptor subunit [Alphaproteobacteria bacterium]|nr:efflux RND transporter periplasmic adaptor subunit [Alphaproteobacteria bacterium]